MSTQAVLAMAHRTEELLQFGDGLLHLDGRAIHFGQILNALHLVKAEGGHTRLRRPLRLLPRRGCSRNGRFKRRDVRLRLLVAQHPEVCRRLGDSEIQGALGRLDSIFRTPFQLHHDGYKYHEIADQLATFS